MLTRYFNCSQYIKIIIYGISLHDKIPLFKVEFRVVCLCWSFNFENYRSVETVQSKISRPVGLLSI